MGEFETTMGDYAHSGGWGQDMATAALGDKHLTMGESTMRRFICEILASMGLRSHRKVPKRLPRSVLSILSTMILMIVRAINDGRSQTMILLTVCGVFRCHMIVVVWRGRVMTGMSGLRRNL